MSAPRCSVVIPSYNRRALLKQSPGCAESRRALVGEQASCRFLCGRPEAERKHVIEKRTGKRGIHVRQGQRQR